MKFIFLLVLLSSPLYTQTVKVNHYHSSLDYTTTEWVEDMSDMIPEGTTSFPKKSSLGLLTVYGERKIINLTDLDVNDYRVSSGKIKQYS